MKRKLIMLLSVFTLLSLLGCSADNKTDSVETKTPEVSEDVLSVWAWDPNFNIYALKEAEKIYQETNPNFKLDIQENIFNDIETKLVVAAQSNDYSTLPDIILMQDYSYEKFVKNFPDLFADLTSSGINFAEFSQGKVASSTIDSKNYGVPFDNGVSVMALRKDIIEEAGLTVDQFSDKTWNEFIELGKVVKEKTGLPMLTASAGAETVMHMIQSSGQSVYVDGKIDLVNNEALLEAMNTYKQLVDEGILMEYTDWDQYIASINTGKAAGLIQGCWIMSSIQNAEDQSGKWVLSNLPRLETDGATNYASMGGASWAVSKNGNIDLATDFLNKTFASNVEFYNDLLSIGAITSYLPAANTSKYQEASEFYGGQKVYADIVEFSAGIPAFSYGAYLSEVRSALTDAITNVIQNDADITSEIKAAQDAVDFSIE
ncbi:MAG: ABC transporter substrate-binding protein [Anaerorhabdus sp.]